jgi:hypothetical protein
LIHSGQPRSPGAPLHDGVAPGEHRGVEIVERHRVGVEALVQTRWQPAQGAEVAGHDQQPPARTHDRAEGAQHPRRAHARPFPTAVAAIQPLGAGNDSAVDATEDAAAFSDANVPV